MLSYFMHMIFGASVPALLPLDQPLPPNPYSQFLNPEIHTAYNQCLLSQVDAGDDVKLLMYTRCLGFLIIEAPSDEARDYLSSEITQCGGDVNKMNNLAKFYIENLFRLFRKYKGRTPWPSSHPSRDEERLFFSSTVDPTPKDHLASKRAALERDNFRCMVTGCVDTEYYLNLSADDKIAVNPSQTDHTNFTHIFPPSTSQGLEPEQPGHSKFVTVQTHYAGTVWGTILKYGDIDVLDELKDSHCHRLYNGLTLTASVRNDFDRLQLWFEAIPNAQHTYRVCTLIPICGSVHSLPHPRIVTFSTTTNLPLPDPRYLKLHAVVCRVGHLSDVTTYLDKYDREQEERNFMAYDGSSAEYLTSRLHSILGA